MIVCVSRKLENIADTPVVQPKIFQCLVDLVQFQAPQRLYQLYISKII